MHNAQLGLAPPSVAAAATPPARRKVAAFLLLVCGFALVGLGYLYDGVSMAQAGAPLLPPTPTTLYIYALPLLAILLHRVLAPRPVSDICLCGLLPVWCAQAWLGWPVGVPALLAGLVVAGGAALTVHGLGQRARPAPARTTPGQDNPFVMRRR